MDLTQYAWCAKLQVADFFAHLVKRVSPKSYTQALAEVTITRRFLENFAGDSVRCHLCALRCIWRLAVCHHKYISLQIAASPCRSASAPYACQPAKMRITAYDLMMLMKGIAFISMHCCLPSFKGSAAAVHHSPKTHVVIKVRWHASSFGVPGDHPGQQSNGYRWPFGPVGLITPFNFPLEIPALQIMGALFMGNKVLAHVDHRRACIVPMP